MINKVPLLLILFFSLTKTTLYALSQRHLFVKYLTYYSSQVVPLVTSHWCSTFPEKSVLILAFTAALDTGLCCVTEIKTDHKTSAGMSRVHRYLIPHSLTLGWPVMESKSVQRQMSSEPVMSKNSRHTLTINIYIFYCSYLTLHSDGLVDPDTFRHSNRLYLP